MSVDTKNDYFDPPRYAVPGMPDMLAGKAPRVSFTGVTARVFPLKASMNRLQAFCDNYLNFLDDGERMKKSQSDFFRPAAPYVYFQVINYGKMATESQNLGWIAQNEILFCLPLEWYKVDQNGELVFHDWAMICPFIFVDNDMSLTTGRETYGWTKVRGWLEGVPSTWAKDPRRPRRLLNMRTEMFAGLYSGGSLEPKTLIEVTAEQPPIVSPTMLARRDTFNPIWGIPDAVRSSIELSGNLFEAFTNLPILGYKRRDLSSLSRMSARALRNLLGVVPWLPQNAGAASGAASPNLYFNQVTLKQFRDAAEPQYACYQALVNSRVTVDHYYDVGALGGPNLAVGDLSGGYRVKVHEYTEQPIVQTLGLDIDESVSGDDGAPTAILKPTMPFWLSCDLSYDTGDTVSWRGKTSSAWHNSLAQSQPEQEGGDAGPGATEDDAIGRSSIQTPKNRFNTTGGAANQEISGPFHYPNSTLRVFPLMADDAKLEKFCDDYLNKIDNVDEIDGIDGNFFEPWGSYVYMIVTTYGQEEKEGDKMWSEQNNIGGLAECDVSFCVPVKWLVKREGQSPVLRSTALLTPYMFASSSRHAISEREINGRQMLHSVIKSGDDSWLRESGPVRPRSLVTVKTLLMPALNVGQAAEMLDVIEISEKQPEEYNEDIEWSNIKAKWKPCLDQDYARKLKQRDENQGGGGRWAQMLQLFKNVSKNQAGLNFLALKQYRDTTWANRACYQSLVLLRKKITAIFNIQEMHKSKHVLIHKYPTLPIVETLGLKVKATDSEESSVVEWLEPIRPFFMHVSLKDELGVKVCGRVNSKDWDSDDDDSEDLDWSARSEIPIRVRVDLKQEEKERLKRQEEKERLKRQEKQDETVSLLENITEPKAIIECLLSETYGASDHSYHKYSSECPIYRTNQDFGDVDKEVEAINEPATKDS